VLPETVPTSTKRERRKTSTCVGSLKCNCEQSTDHPAGCHNTPRIPTASFLLRGGLLMNLIFSRPERLWALHGSSFDAHGADDISNTPWEHGNDPEAVPGALASRPPLTTRHGRTSTCVPEAKPRFAGAGVNAVGKTNPIAPPPQEHTAMAMATTIPVALLAVAAVVLAIAVPARRLPAAGCCTVGQTEKVARWPVLLVQATSKTNRSRIIGILPPRCWTSSVGQDNCTSSAFSEYDGELEDGTTVHIRIHTLEARSSKPRVGVRKRVRAVQSAEGSSAGRRRSGQERASSQGRR